MHPNTSQPIISVFNECRRNAHRKFEQGLVENSR